MLNLGSWAVWKQIEAELIFDVLYIGYVLIIFISGKFYRTEGSKRLEVLIGSVILIS